MDLVDLSSQGEAAAAEEEEEMVPSLDHHRRRILQQLLFWQFLLCADSDTQTLRHDMQQPVQCQLGLPGCANSVHHSCQTAYADFQLH